MALNLGPRAARRFFDAQIRMARGVQEHWFERWRGGIIPPLARDLVTELRPQLDAIGRDMLPALYLAATALSEAREQVVGADGRAPGGLGGRTLTCGGLDQPNCRGGLAGDRNVRIPRDFPRIRRPGEGS